MKKFFLFFIIVFLVNFNSVKAEELILFKCVDGDTADFILNDQKIKVRFLAIDTPETKHPTKKQEKYGKEASNYTCTLLKTANKIEIEYDKNSNKKDKYNRHLGWIFIDDKLLQASLIKEGFAKVAYLYDDYKYTSELLILEKQAKNKKIGIWNDYKNDYTEIYMLIALSIIIICIFNKSFRKKTINQIKKKNKEKNLIF